MKRLRASLSPWIAFGLAVVLTPGLGGSAHGQCNDPALTSGQSYYLPHGTTPRFTQGVSFWSAIAVRPEPGTDWDLAVYSAAGPAPTCASGILASSVAGGSATDIVVGDFNHNLHGEYRARVYQYSGTAPWAEVEWDDDADRVEVNGPEIYKSIQGEDIVDTYDVLLSGGTTYRFDFNPTVTVPGMRLLLFRNPSNSAYWVGRSERVLELAGPGTYTAPADDWYGVVVVNQDREYGAYTLGIGHCIQPAVLSSGVVQGAYGQYGHRTFTQNYRNSSLMPVLTG